jgi:hypothetical protein
MLSIHLIQLAHGRKMKTVSTEVMWTHFVINSTRSHVAMLYDTSLTSREGIMPGTVMDTVISILKGNRGPVLVTCFTVILAGSQEYTFDSYFELVGRI